MSAQQEKWTEVEKLTVRMLIVNAMAFSPQVDKEENADKILKEYENQIRRDAVEEYKTKGSWELTAQSVKDIEFEAQKELLDEIENNYHWHIETPLAPEGENEYTLMIDEDDWIKLRAKTLGKKSENESE